MFNAPNPQAHPGRHIHYPKNVKCEWGRKQTIDVTGIVWKNFEEDQVWRAIDRRLGYPISSGIIRGGGAERYRGNYMAGKNAYLYFDCAENAAYFGWYLNRLLVHDPKEPSHTGWYRISADMAGGATMIQWKFHEEQDGDRGFTGNRSARPYQELLDTPRFLKNIDRGETVILWCNFCEKYGHNARDHRKNITCDLWNSSGGDEYTCERCGLGNHHHSVCHARKKFRAWDY